MASKLDRGPWADDVMTERVASLWAFIRSEPKPPNVVIRAAKQRHAIFRVLQHHGLWTGSVIGPFSAFTAKRGEFDRELARASLAPDSFVLMVNFIRTRTGDEGVREALIAARMLVESVGGVLVADRGDRCTPVFETPSR